MLAYTPTASQAGATLAAGIAATVEPSGDDDEPVEGASLVTAAAAAASELRQIIREEIQKQGSQRVVAKSLALTEGRLGRMLRGEFSLSVLSCLRLSKVTGRPPAQILNAAGKGEVAKLIVELYGIEESAMSPNELDLLRRFRRVGAKHQALVRNLLESLGQGTPARAGARKRPARGG